MRCINRKHLKKFYEEEAEHLSHQEIMYLKGNKYQLWWHRKRLYYIVSFLSEIFKKNRIMTFADVGCAEGLYVKYIASIHDGTFCIGADIARTYIKKAKRNSKRLNTDYIVCDIENLPFKADSIDVVLCSEVLEHVYNYHESLAELCRVGKKYLVISFPGHSYLYKIISKIKPMKRFVTNLMPDVGHVSEVEVREVQAFLRGKCKSLKIKIGGVLPLIVYRTMPSVKLVEAVDSLLCKALEYFSAINYVTIHVIKVEKK